ncbi:MAG: hypothetical protein JXB05_16470 [Myxococcaceae bacterium]|nr:hypothetical protein [Myxococcaceae bacterium]
MYEQGVHSHALNPYVQAAAEATVPPTFQSSDGTKFTLTQARIHLRDIRLDLPQGTKCADVRGLMTGAECKGGDTGSGSGTLVVSGPIVADLMTGATTPDLSGLVLPAGAYKRIDFRLEEAHADELPAGEPLIGYSMKVSADFSEQAGKKLELALKFSEDARFESATGVEVPEGGTLIAMLQPSKWLAELPLSSCIQKGDVAFEGDTLLIDERAKGECSGAEDLVKRNIKTSGDLRKHVD